MSRNNVKQPPHLPMKLDEEEVKDPYLVIHRFFDYSDIASVRESLWNFLKITVSGTFSNKNLLSKTQRYDMIYFYEHIEKLIEAAHLINMSQKRKKKNKKQVWQFQNLSSAYKNIHLVRE